MGTEYYQWYHSHRLETNRFLPPANEIYEGYVFTRFCQSFCSQGGVHGGHEWPGGVHAWGHACPRGACVARGACMAEGGVWPGGVHA